MATKWLTAAGRFTRRGKELKEFLTKNFGPMHVEKKEAMSGLKRNNHGRWKFSHNGYGSEIEFRYEKDLVWFTLYSAQFVDPTIHPSIFTIFR